MVIISVFDSCACRFSALGIEQNVQTAKRGFRNAIIEAQDNPESLYFTNPADFELFMLGEFDLDSGRINALEEPECIYKGSTVINEFEIMECGE